MLNQPAKPALNNEHVAPIPAKNGLSPVAPSIWRSNSRKPLTVPIRINRKERVATARGGRVRFVIMAFSLG